MFVYNIFFLFLAQEPKNYIKRMNEIISKYNENHLKQRLNTSNIYESIPTVDRQKQIST
jgi:hypothetical protein